MIDKRQMRTVLLASFWVVAVAIGHSAEPGRPTLQTLVGREFLIRDDWAGQSMTFKSKAGALVVVWRILGSGRPVLSEVEYPVGMNSPWQCVFDVRLRDESKGRMKVGLGDRSEVLAYLNGVRIMLDENRPLPAPPPATPGGRGRP